jgi:4-alpha-glucanotransferase
MQDVLQLDSEARMNTPAQPEGNWAWRYRQDALQPWISEKLAALTEVTDRDGWVDPTATTEAELLAEPVADVTGESK